MISSLLMIFITCVIAVFIIANQELIVTTLDFIFPLLLMVGFKVLIFIEHQQITVGLGYELRLLILIYAHLYITFIAIGLLYRHNQPTIPGLEKPITRAYLGVCLIQFLQNSRDIAVYCF